MTLYEVLTLCREHEGWRDYVNQNGATPWLEAYRDAGSVEDVPEPIVRMATEVKARREAGGE